MNVALCFKTVQDSRTFLQVSIVSGFSNFAASSNAVQDSRTLINAVMAFGIWTGYMCQCISVHLNFAKVSHCSSGHSNLRCRFQYSSGLLNFAIHLDDAQDYWTWLYATIQFRTLGTWYMFPYCSGLSSLPILFDRLRTLELCYTFQYGSGPLNFDIHPITFRTHKLGYVFNAVQDSRPSCMFQ